MDEVDLFVIGAGSGGVRAARVAAAHGATVAVAEEHRVGGTCVIRGCVPKKLLVYGAHFAEDLRDARRFGWHVPECEFDWAVLRDHVLAEVTRLEVLYQKTLAAHSVTILHQRAAITGSNEVRLQDGSRYRARIILIATGARPVIPDVAGAEHGITSNEIFHLKTLPIRIVIIGGGYIANEFAGIFNELGTKVTVVNRGPHLLRHYDESVRNRLLALSMKKGIDFRFHARIDGIEKGADGSLQVHMADQEPIAADCLLYACGRRPNSQALGLQSVGVELGPHGAIRVNDENRTSVDSIFAVGDVTDRIQLTPVAIREGQAFADTQFGKMPRRVDYSCVPTAVFSHPPIAAVGLTEAAARKMYGAVKVYTADFRPMRNVLANRDERALYKMVTDADTGKVLGLHMIGPDAPEILQAAAVAIRAGLTKQEFDDTVALHPTMAEELLLMK